MEHADANTPRDGFAAVFGNNRGRGIVDTILSVRPTEAGREELTDFVAGMREGDFEHTLAILTTQHALIPTRPLLRELASELCLHLLANESNRFDNEVRRFLDGTGVFTKDGGYLLSVAEQKPKLSGQSAQQSRCIHLWPEGESVGPISCLRVPSQSVCGLAINRTAWRRMPRGAWTADNLVQIGLRLCLDCARDCPPALTYVLKETPQYVPFGAELYKRMLKSIRQRTLKYLAEGEFTDFISAQRLAGCAYREMLLPAAIKAATEGGEATLQNVLGEREYRALTIEHEGEIAPLLSSDDWREILDPCVPRVIDDQPVIATDEDFARMRTLIGERVRVRGSIETV